MFYWMAISTNSHVKFHYLFTFSKLIIDCRLRVKE